jgi:hypothetical protein
VEEALRLLARIARLVVRWDSNCVAFKDMVLDRGWKRPSWGSSWGEHHVDGSFCVSRSKSILGA